MCQQINSIISLCIQISVIILIFLIRADTSKDIFNEEFAPGEKEKLFYNIDKNSIIQVSEIDIKCEMLQNAIMSPKVTKLGDVFSINTEVIHDKTSTLLIIWFAAFSLSIFYFICVFLNLRSNNFTIVCLSCAFIMFTFASVIINLIALYRLIRAFYWSDVNQFLKFLKCKNIVRDEFSKYYFVEDLYYHVFYFIIFSILQMFFNKSNNNKPENRRERSNEVELNEI